MEELTIVVSFSYLSLSYKIVENVQLLEKYFAVIKGLFNNMKQKYINLLILIFLIILNFVSHTMQYKNMGLYEDDYGFFGQSFNRDSAEYHNYLTNTFEKWTRGTPLGYTFPTTTAYLVRENHPLQTLYMIGLAILCINSFLLYKIALKWLGDITPAIIAAIAFTLFPADTTKGYLTHLYHIQISVMFCLISAYIFLYFPKMRFLSYFFALLCLFQYETTYSLFFLLPLFTEERKQKKIWVQHLIFATGLLCLAVGLRVIHQEARIMGLSNWLLIFAQITAGMVIGPVVSMGLFLYGPARTVLHMNHELFIVMLIAFPIFAAGLLWLNKSRAQEIESRNSDKIKHLKLFTISIQLPEWIWKWLQSIAFASIWLMSAYLLAFTHFPPIARYGRGTSVHIAATIPASLLAAVIIWGIWKMLAQYRIYRVIYVFLVAGYISITIGNRYSIQQDFVNSWAFQKQYWNEIIDLVPDANDETIIFVVDHNLPKVHYIDSTTWTDYLILGDLISFPSEWEREPMVLTTDGNWESNLQIKDGKIFFPWSLYWNFEIDPENVIFLTDTNDGHLIRIDNTAIQTLSGTYIQSLKFEETLPLSEKYQTTRLYDLMIEEKE